MTIHHSCHPFTVNLMLIQILYKYIIIRILCSWLFCGWAGLFRKVPGGCVWKVSTKKPWTCSKKWPKETRRNFLLMRLSWMRLEGFRTTWVTFILSILISRVVTKAYFLYECVDISWLRIRLTFYAWVYSNFWSIKTLETYDYGILLKNNLRGRKDYANFLKIKMICNHH